MKRCYIAALATIALTGSPTRAAEPQMALDPCINAAAEYHRVNPKAFKAIVFQESSGRAHIMTRNSNESVDYGASGINSIHLPELAKFGITEQHLLDGCTNVFVGAWKYSKKVAKYGNTWRAVGAYHSETPQRRDHYITLIQRHLVKWGHLLPMRDDSGSVTTLRSGPQP